MQKWSCLIAVAIVACAATPLQALDLSPLVGTVEVQFQPIQSAGVREGCSLVYYVLGQDHAYRHGNLIGLAGNIAVGRNKDRTNIGLSLKVGTIDALDPSNKHEAPFFAYIESPHGTTARSKFVQADMDKPGTRLFVYQLDAGAMKVLEDIRAGASVKIGFNRSKGGMDVLVPLDLHVVESTPSGTGVSHRQSDEMVRQFASCSDEIFEQVRKQLETK